MRDEASREPIATYQQAVYTLLSVYGAYEWLYDPDKDMPPVAKIVCDIYWVNESTLRRDLQRAWGGE